MVIYNLNSPNKLTLILTIFLAPILISIPGSKSGLNNENLQPLSQSSSFDLSLREHVAEIKIAQAATDAKLDAIQYNLEKSFQIQAECKATLDAILQHIFVSPIAQVDCELQISVPVESMEGVLDMETNLKDPTYKKKMVINFIL